jgi:hypothetical protein
MKILDIPQSGKVGLTVNYKGRNGQVRRAFVVPANPRTIYQTEVRGNLTTVGHRFKTLTTSQQDAWDTAGRRYQTRSRLGQSGPMTGYQLFAKINCTLAQFGQDQVDVPPGPPNPPAVAPQSLVITNAGGVVALKLTCPTNPGQNTIVRAAAPVSSGVRSVPATRIIGTCPVPTGGSADITSLYTARFGAPVAGDRIFVECNTMAEGWEGPKMTFTALVPTST